MPHTDPQMYGEESARAPAAALETHRRFCTQATLTSGCFWPGAEHSRDTKAGGFLGGTGFHCWMTWAHRLPIGLAEPSFNLHFGLSLFLLKLPSFSLSFTGRRPAGIMIKGSASLLRLPPRLPSYMVALGRPPAGPVSFWCPLLQGSELNQWGL